MAPKKENKPTATRHDMFTERFAAIPEIANLGPLFKSSQSVELTGETFLHVFVMKEFINDHFYRI